MMWSGYICVEKKTKMKKNETNSLYQRRCDFKKMLQIKEGGSSLSAWGGFINISSVVV
jgi:hypothetical protein